MSYYPGENKLITKIKLETKKALENLEKIDLPLPLKALLKNLTNEIEWSMADGDWGLAVKLSYYRHEFAKLHNNHDWYTVFLEIRKIRDTIDLFSKEKNGEKASS
mgnify:CR=1 FL=1